MSTTRTVLAVTMAMFFLPIGFAVAAEDVAAEDVAAKKMDVKYKIDEMTCREMLKMSGDARDFTMIFMHGFMSGKKSELLFDPVPLTEATDKVIDSCIDNPNDKLLSVFEKARS